MDRMVLGSEVAFSRSRTALRIPQQRHVRSENVQSESDQHQAAGDFEDRGIAFDPLRMAVIPNAVMMANTPSPSAAPSPAKNPFSGP